MPELGSFLSRESRKLAGLLLLTACASARAPHPGSAGTAGPVTPSGNSFCLRLHTAHGAIDLELFRAAAPGAFSRLEQLANRPRHDPAAPNAFDGAAFAYARPRLELRLTPVAQVPDEEDPIVAELDGSALSLDRERIEDRGQAMNAMQHELLPALERPNAERAPTPTLEEWHRRFELDYDPSFLIGKSRQELLEAIGYRFREGLESRPAKRGAVALVPISPTEASPTLALLLADHSSRTGRWVVVGEIVGGLEVAEAISRLPLESAAARNYLPAEPVIVSGSETLQVCPRGSSGGSS